ncbi:hypothetical protein ACOSQ3_023679 [Xanthoceras sorbifolium]
MISFYKLLSLYDLSFVGYGFLPERSVFVVIVKQLEFPEFLLCLLPALALCTRRRLVLSKPRSRGIIA